MGATNQPNTNPNAVAGLARGRETRRKNRERGILTGRRLTFAQLMVNPQMTPAEAYVKAGYSPKSAQKGAWRLMADPVVKRYITEQRAKAAKRNEVSEDEVIRNLRSLRDQAEQDGNWSSAISATELLGTFLKMFDQKVTVEHHENPTQVFISSSAPEDRKSQTARLAVIGGRTHE
jgi:phage terminase small subunit